MAREGAAAPAFLLEEYGSRRRHATLVAQLLELETHLSNATVGMFIRLILGFFTKARKGISHRYQATARESADLMRLLLDSAIGWERLLAARPMAAEFFRHFAPGFLESFTSPVLFAWNRSIGGLFLDK